MQLVKIEGIDAVARMLKDIAPREARSLIGQTVQDVAVQVVDYAKPNMPERTGAMIKGTYARREKIKGNLLSSTVRVKGAYWWRFQEYGQGPDHVEHAMFFRAKERVLGELDVKFLDAFARRLVARLSKL